jgi:arylsulfatase A-like enzyme/Flp pilus assembly protein TadD
MREPIQTGAAAAAVVASALLFGSCKSSNPPPRTRPNLVLVTIDTLRADRLGCYSNSHIETPNLDRIAKQGVVFENAVTHTPLTAPSHASIFTGLYPTVHGVRDTGGFVLKTSHPTLAEILRRQGWNTAAFVGSSVLKAHFGFNQGFDVYEDEMPRPGPDRIAADYVERRAGEVVDKAIAWLGSQSGGPFFLWVHVFDPHSPYDPPSPFRERYSGRAYEGEVAYTDQELGRLFAAVETRSLPENTLVAVLSDHGESLSEHGEYTHGVFLYDSTLRIAFLLAGPGVPKGLRVKQQARAIDVLQTLLDLMAIQAPPGVQGTSLVPALRGKRMPESPAYIETLYPKLNMRWAELRGIRTDRWKYIRAPKPELYDLLRDPAETNNIIGNHSAEVQQLEVNLKVLATDAEKVQTTMADPRTLAQLKSLGYLGGSSAQEYTLTGKGIDPKDRFDVLKSLYLAVSPDAGSPASERVPLLRKALAEDPANPTIYYHLGNEYGRAGRAADALNLYQDGLRNGVTNAWLFSRLAYLSLQRGNKNEAIGYFERAAQLNPSDNESLNDLGMAYLETGKLADAERAFKWSVAADGKYALAYNGLGLVSIEKHDLPAARGNFEKAVQFDPDLLEAQLNLGRIYQIMGAKTRARACFEAFLAKASPAEFGAIIPKVKAELAEMK